MNPTIIKGIAAVILLALAVAGFESYRAHVFNEGYAKAAAKAKIREDGIREDAEKQHDADTAQALQRERDLRGKLDTESSQRLTENEQHEQTENDLRARIRNGSERLRSAIDPRSIPTCAQTADPAVAGRPGDETRADLMPAVAEDILRIAGGSAKDVRDYNAVVDAYNAARAVCNAP